MILNLNDWLRAAVRVTMLKGRLDYLRRRIANPAEAAAARAEIERMENRISELCRELQRYQSLCSRTEPPAKPIVLADIPRSLIERRISAGLSQTGLARLMGVTRQTLSRYERTGFVAVTLARMVQMDSILREHEIAQLEKPILSASSAASKSPGFSPRSRRRSERVTACTASQRSGSGG